MAMLYYTSFRFPFGLPRPATSSFFYTSNGIQHNVFTTIARVCHEWLLNTVYMLDMEQLTYPSMRHSFQISLHMQSGKSELTISSSLIAHRSSFKNVSKHLRITLNANDDNNNLTVYAKWLQSQNDCMAVHSIAFCLSQQFLRIHIRGIFTSSSSFLAPKAMHV